MEIEDVLIKEAQKGAKSRIERNEPDDRLVQRLEIEATALKVVDKANKIILSIAQGHHSWTDEEIVDVADDIVRSFYLVGRYQQMLKEAR